MPQSFSNLQWPRKVRRSHQPAARRRKLFIEPLEKRIVLAAELSLSLMSMPMGSDEAALTAGRSLEFANASALRTAAIRSDLNADGHVTPIDALLVVDVMNGLSASSAALDVNGDGAIDAMDFDYVIGAMDLAMEDAAIVNDAISGDQSPHQTPPPDDTSRGIAFSSQLDVGESAHNFQIGFDLADIRPVRTVSSPGDMNGDGIVSPIDALIIINAKLNNDTIEQQLDVTGDGVISDSDVAWIIAHMPGEIVGDSPITVPSKTAEPIIDAGPPQVGSELIDAGDYYWADGRRIALLRSSGKMAVGIKDGASREAVAAALIGQDGVLSGYEIHSDLGDGGFLLQVGGDSQALAAVDVQTALAATFLVDGLEWTAPVLVNSESGLIQIAGNEIVVALEDGVQIDSLPLDQVVEYKPYTSDQYLLRLATAGEDAIQFALMLTEQPGVAWAEPNFYSEFVSNYLPVDSSLFNDQWHLNNTGQTNATSDADVDAPAAWDTTTGSSNVTIAVIDTGVQTNHPDLNL